MSILIVQLSDIHLLSTADPVLTRIEEIARAILSECDSSVVGCVLVNCGDSAQSGLIDQYDLAFRLFDTIRDMLRRRLGDAVAIEILAIPGNHDCDLSEDQTARDLMLDSPVELESMISSSCLPVILGPQTNYFEFSRRLVGDDRSLTRDQPFYRAVDLVFGATRLRFHLVNSAWMSPAKERMGAIKFPLDMIPISNNSAPEASLAITMIHHPFHWFRQPEFMRPLRERLESISDLILTGHEHVAQTYSKEIFGRDEHLYIEGGALQERGNRGACSFNVIRIDFADKLQTLTTYNWDSGGHFGIASGPSTTPLTINRGRPDRVNRLNSQFEEWIDDIELPINHPRRNRIRLSEIFIYPDLRVLKNSSSEVLRRTKSEKAFETLITHDRVLVTGSEQSGKTSLAKRLFADLHRTGMAPLFLDATELKRSAGPDNLRKILGKVVKKQYEKLTPEQYEQIPIDNKTLIVDNIQDMAIDHEASITVFSHFERHFKRVILIGDDEYCLEEIYNSDKKPSMLANYERYNICEFGFYLLELMARKWLSLSSGHGGEDLSRSDENVRRIVAQVEQVLRTNLIPHHPWVLIALLQSVDTAQGPAAKNGSYGYLLGAIITFALDSSNYPSIDINGKYTILGEYAFVLYRKNEASLSAAEVDLFFRKYKDAYEIDFDNRKLLEDLVRAGLLRSDGGDVAFSSKYSYCFFVAHYLSRRIHQPEIRQIVGELSRRLYHEESANIIVFLAHLSSDPIVLEEMKKTAATLFAGFPLAEFKDDVAPINKLCQIDMMLALPDSTPSQNRRKEQEAQDETLVRRDSRSVDGRAVKPLPDESCATPDDAYSALLNIQASKRTIKILGQVLQNGAASIPGPEKRLIVHEIFGLGRRLMGMLYQRFPEDMPEWRRELLGHYRGKLKDATETKIVEQAHRFLFELHWLATLGTITVVSEAVGASLLEETFRKVLEEDSSLPNQIIDLSIKLTRPGHLPKRDAVELYRKLEGNRLIQITLRSMVVNHLYLYEVKREEKQSICSELKIKLPPQASNPKLKRFDTRARKRHGKDG